jgi:hypothetical protein
MCYIEYNWTASVWQFRIADRFTDFQGVRSWQSLREARAFFLSKGCVLTKTDSRTYRVECSLDAKIKA